MRLRPLCGNVIMQRAALSRRLPTGGARALGRRPPCRRRRMAQLYSSNARACRCGRSAFAANRVEAAANGGVSLLLGRGRARAETKASIDSALFTTDAASPSISFLLLPPPERGLFSAKSRSNSFVLAPSHAEPLFDPACLPRSLQRRCRSGLSCLYHRQCVLRAACRRQEQLAREDTTADLIRRQRSTMCCETVVSIIVLPFTH